MTEKENCLTESYVHHKLCLNSPKEYVKELLRVVNFSNKNVNSILFELLLPIYFYIIGTGHFNSTFCEFLC